MSSFDTLVSGLSDKERMEILQRMQASTSAMQMNMSVPEKLDLADGAFDIKTRIEKLPVFERLILWLKATFSNSSMEDAYNRSRVASYAHEIEHQYLGLMDYRHHVVLDMFLTRLQELRSAAKFFEPYVSAYEKNPGAFYVLLGSLVMPGEHAEIESEADPYAFSVEKELDPELHSSLLKKLDEALSSIPETRRKVMYASVASVEWLRAFTRLPLERMASKFAMGDGGRKVCHFDNMGKDFCDFAGVMCNGKTLSDESLEALYLFHAKQAALSPYPQQNPVGEFMSTAALQMTAISSFIRTVPVRKMVCVIANNVQFVPAQVSGGEDWYVKFRSEWKMLFERKWTQWMADYEKERIREEVSAAFGYENIPLFPYRPWTSVWDGVPFRYELSLGFSYAFFKDCFIKYMKALKHIALEGDFAIKENRVEFTDTCNMLSRINDDLDVIATQLSAGGEFGLLFAKYEGQSQKKPGDVKSVRDALKQVEFKVASVMKSLLEALHSMESLMDGILSEHITSYYGPVVNLARIQAKEGKNKAFVQSLRECRFGMSHACAILSAIAPLELPTSFIP